MYKYIVREKITGIALSRHRTRALAGRAWNKAHTDRNPCEIIAYSESYWREMR
jgi:hypothetical protein